MEKMNEEKQYEIIEINRESFPIGAESENMVQWMKSLADAPYYKKMGGLPAMMSIVLTGRELGVSPMVSLNGGFVDIQGKIVMSSELMRSLVRKRGHTIIKISHDEKHCMLKGIRKDDKTEWEEVFTIEDAAKAGLSNRDNWKKHPRDMLFASCSRKLCRALFPDVLGGTTQDESKYEEIEVIEEPKENPLSKDTALFIDKHNLLDEGNELSIFIDRIAATLSKKRIDVIADAAKDEEKFLLSFENYKKKKK
jgi:hypothetical protein